MPSTPDHHALPPDLPVPVDDGAADHLTGTLVVEDGVIAKAFYPVFPPDRNAADVLAWLHERR